MLSNRPHSVPESRASAAEATRQMLARLWQKNTPLFRERMRVLTLAVAAATEGKLGHERRAEAAEEAHKLAGSLGMFGYPQGSVLAREAEQMLDGDAVLDVARLRVLLNEMQQILPL